MSHPHPRASRRALAGLTVAGLAIAPFAVPAAFASHDPLKHKQKQAHHRVHQAQLDFDDSSAALNQAASRLASAQRSLSAAQTKLAGTRTALAKATAVEQQMQAKLNAAKAAVTAAQARVAAATKQVADQRDQIGAMASYNLYNGDPQWMTFNAIMNSGSPVDAMRQLTAAHSIAAQQKAVYVAYTAEQAALQKEQDRLTAVKQQVATQEAAAAATVQQKEALTAQAKTETDAVAALVRSRESAKAAAARIRASDLVKLHALQRQEERIKEEILRRARGAANHRVGSTQGLFLRPLPGPITSPFGWRMHPIYHYWGLHDGVDLAASCGQPEIAAGGGTVISEYYSDVWGNRLYLDLGKYNGHSYTAIYNHLSGYAVRTGARVYRGQKIAYAGTTGWSTGCHLHFTILKDGTAVNPAPLF